MYLTSTDHQFNAVLAPVWHLLGVSRRALIAKAFVEASLHQRGPPQLTWSSVAACKLQSLSSASWKAAISFDPRPAC